MVLGWVIAKNQPEEKLFCFFRGKKGNISKACWQTNQELQNKGKKKASWIEPRFNAMQSYVEMAVQDLVA